MIIIKVLHVISGNDYGGGAKYVMNICKAPEDKIDSYLCCVGNGPLLEMARGEGIKAEALSMKNILNGGLNFLIKDRSIDIVNFHGAKSNFLYFFIHKSIAVPTLVTLHSDFRYDFLNNRIKFMIYTPLSILGLRKFKNYACVSETLKSLLEEKKFKGTKTVIQNGIEIAKYNHISESEDIRLKYDIKQDDFLFVMVARIHPIKNHKSVILAFKRLKENYRNIKLLFVGDGELEAVLREEVLEHNLDKDIMFCGFKKNSIDFMAASNISLLASFNEGGAPPIVILESGLVKKPVICTNAGDMASIIDEDEGYLIDPNSVDDIYEKMKEAIINRNELSRMGEQLYRKVCSEYSINIFWDKYFQFYTQILAEK